MTYCLAEDQSERQLGARLLDKNLETGEAIKTP